MSRSRFSSTKEKLERLSQPPLKSTPHVFGRLGSLRARIENPCEPGDAKSMDRRQVMQSVKNQSPRRELVAPGSSVTPGVMKIMIAIYWSGRGAILRCSVLQRSNLAAWCSPVYFVVAAREQFGQK